MGSIVKPMGAAIIGCGAIFPLHAEALSKLDHVTLRMVVDSDLDKAQQAASTYGCEAAADYSVLLGREDIQVVHLCTPHHLHAPMAIELLAVGKHVLTEKPMAENLKNAVKMLEAASASTGQIGVVFQNRYNESSQRIKDIIASGSLGDLICMKGIVTWHRAPDYYAAGAWRGKWATEGGGVLINQAIHTLDLLQWFGGEVSSIRGSATTDVLGDVIEVEDTAHACIDFDNGARGLFYATNAYATNSPVELEIVFEHGILHQRRDSLYLWKDNEEILLCQPPSVNGKGKSYWGTSHEQLIADFYHHVQMEKPFWIDANEGIKVLKMISDLYDSSRERPPVASPKQS